jgi:hypothetical protein
VGESPRAWLPPISAEHVAEIDRPDHLAIAEPQDTILEGVVAQFILFLGLVKGLDQLGRETVECGSAAELIQESPEADLDEEKGPKTWRLATMPGVATVRPILTGWYVVQEGLEAGGV